MSSQVPTLSTQIQRNGKGKSFLRAEGAGDLRLVAWKVTLKPPEGTGSVINVSTRDSQVT